MELWFTSATRRSSSGCPHGLLQNQFIVGSLIFRAWTEQNQSVASVPQTRFLGSTSECMWLSLGQSGQFDSGARIEHSSPRVEFQIEIAA
jgi:hypothetical protein